MDEKDKHHVKIGLPEDIVGAPVGASNLCTILMEKNVHL